MCWKTTSPQLRQRQATIEAELGRRRAELTTIQADLRRERARIVRLRARLAEARIALADRLVHLYKADEPDLVTVVLESNGFEDLLQRTEFMQRVSQQDARIIDRVRSARAEAAATEMKLDRSEARQRKVTAIVEDRREEVAAIKGRLVDRSAAVPGGAHRQAPGARLDTRGPQGARRAPRRARARRGAGARPAWPAAARRGRSGAAPDR